MKEYKCLFCNYNTNKNYNFNKHLATKKHKMNEEKYGLKIKKVAKNPHKTSQNLTKSPKIPHKTSQNLKNLHICEFCNKNFKRRDNLTRHINKYCKENINKKKEESLIKQLEESKKEKQKLYDYIGKLIEKAGDTFIEHNTQNNQINLNNFGEEDISHINDKFMQKLINIPFGGVQRMIERVHFSKKKPENKNIALTNKKENMVKIYTNKRWKYKNRNEIMEELINTNYTRIDDYYNEKGKNKLTQSRNNIYTDFQNKFESNDNKLHEKIKQECEMILMNDNL
jgi:hypothetical protein